MTPGTLLAMVETELADVSAWVDTYQRRKTLLREAASRLRLGVSEEEVLAALRAKGVGLLADGLLTGRNEG